MGPHQHGDSVAQEFDLFFPGGPIHDPVVFLLGGPGTQRVAGSARQGGHRGVIEIGPSAGNRKLVLANSIPEIVHYESPPSSLRCPAPATAAGLRPRRLPSRPGSSPEVAQLIGLSAAMTCR